MLICDNQFMYGFSTFLKSLPCFMVSKVSLCIVYYKVSGNTAYA